MITELEEPFLQDFINDPNEILIYQNMKWKVVKIYFDDYYINCWGLKEYKVEIEMIVDEPKYEQLSLFDT